MTIDMLHHASKEAISRLHPMAKRELMAYFNNQLAIIVGRADMIANEARNEGDLDAALVIARTGRKWAQELETLFTASDKKRSNRLTAVDENQTEKETR